MNHAVKNAASAVKQALFSPPRFKQVLLIRHDLKLPKGKMVAQAAHASVDAVLKADKGLVREWRGEGMMKIVLKAKDQKELLQLHHQASEEGLVTAIISDAGHTVVAPGTITACAIGPGPAAAIDRITKRLPLM